MMKQTKAAQEMIKFWPSVKLADAVRDLGGTHYSLDEPMIVSGGRRLWPDATQWATIHNTPRGNIRMCKVWHIASLEQENAILAAMAGRADPMAPDHDALAEKPMGQVEDCRDSTEVVSAPYTMDYDDETLEGERKGKAVDGLLEDLEECQQHIETIKDQLIALGFDMRLLEPDPMAPDYTRPGRRGTDEPEQG